MNVLPFVISVLILESMESEMYPTSPRSIIQLVYLFTLDHSSTRNIVFITIHVRVCRYVILFILGSIPNSAGTMGLWFFHFSTCHGRGRCWEEREIQDVILGGAVSAFSFLL